MAFSFQLLHKNLGRDQKKQSSRFKNYLGAKRDFNDYLNSKMLRLAIEREFEIIGKAMNRIDKSDDEIVWEQLSDICQF